MCVDFSIYGLIHSSSLITVNRLITWTAVDLHSETYMIAPLYWQQPNQAYHDWRIQLVIHNGVTILVSIKNLKQEKLIKKSRDCYKPLGVLKNSFKRVREFYIELKLGSVGFLREGKTGENPLQQGKNQRRNLDFGFQSLAGFRIPHKKTQGISIPQGKISRVPESGLPSMGRSVHFQKRIQRRDPGPPYF